MRIAVVGAGAAGLATAWMLQDEAEITLFESETELGGHTRSISVEFDGEAVPVDIGFKYLTLPSHRRTMAWLSLLGVPVRAFRSSLSLTWEETPRTLVLPPKSLRDVMGLFAHWRWLPYVLGIVLFKWLTRRIVRAQDWRPTLGKFSSRLLPKDVSAKFLQPFFAANWGATSKVMASFPLLDVSTVLPKSTGLAYDIAGGTSSYVKTLLSDLRSVQLRPGCGVRRVRPVAGGVRVEFDGGEATFDQVILALPGHRARMLLAPDAAALSGWRAALDGLTSFPTHIVVHSDPSWMPADRRDWCLINQFHRDGEAFLTEWAGWLAGRPVFRTWVPEGREMPKSAHFSKHFQHLVVTPESHAMQQRVAAAQGTHGLWAAGMYVTEVDIHESSIASALGVAEAIAPQAKRVLQFRSAIGEGRMPEVRVTRPVDPSVHEQKPSRGLLPGAGAAE